MRQLLFLVLAFVFVGVCLVSWIALSNANFKLKELQVEHASNTATITQQQSDGQTRSEEKVQSNARLRLLADYTRSSAESNDVSDLSSMPFAPTLPANSLPATVPATGAHTAAPRRSTPPPPPPPPATPKLSALPVLQIKNTALRTTANLSVSDYVSGTLLSTVYLPKAPSDVAFHYTAASGIYEVSATVSYEGSTLQTKAVCTESATIILSVIAHLGAADLRCDPAHAQPDTVTVVNSTPEDAQITVVDGVSGSVIAQNVLRQGAMNGFKEGKPNAVLVVYARIAGINWQPAACYYRGTISITGSRHADGGIRLSCDDAHRAPPTLRIINGSGECPVYTSVHIAQKDGSSNDTAKPLDEFAVSCGATAESYIGVTANSYRQISVKMADGTTPSIVCPAASTVLIGGSGIHC